MNTNWCNKTSQLKLLPKWLINLPSFYSPVCVFFVLANRFSWNLLTLLKFSLSNEKTFLSSFLGRTKKRTLCWELFKKCFEGFCLAFVVSRESGRETRISRSDGRDQQKKSWCHKLTNNFLFHLFRFTKFNASLKLEIVVLMVSRRH